MDMEKKKKKVTRKQLKQLYINLGWLIRECKCLYYHPEANKTGLKPPPDAWYDKVEEKYKKVAEKLDLPTSAIDRVGFDPTAGSGALIMMGKFPMIHKYYLKKGPKK